jgi:hypothetical protein
MFFSLFPGNSLKPMRKTGACLEKTVLATKDICLENELTENKYPNRLEQIVADNRNI